MLQSILSSARSRQENCLEHGAYLSYQMPSGQWSPCPICVQEDIAKADLAHQYQSRRKAKAAVAEKQSLARHLKAQIPPRFRSRTLENYQAYSPQQQRCLATCQKYLAAFEDRYQQGGGLVLLGKPGTGKTHLAAAIGNALLEQGRDVLFIDVYDLIDSIKEAAFDLKECSEFSARRRFTDVELLILDEVGVQLGTDWEKTTLFKVVNDRYKAGKPSILISNLDRANFKHYIGDRIDDRMQEGGGAFLSFDWPSYRAQAYHTGEAA